MSDDRPLPDKLAHAYEQLKAAADELNAVSDELGKHVDKIEEKLEFLNLGVSTWVPISGGDSEDGQEYWLLELGYAKVTSRWGVAIRTRSGSNVVDEERKDEWLYGNAPRRYRAEAVEKLPDLLTKLIDEATKTTKKLRDKVDKAHEIANSFGPKVTAGMQRKALSGDFANDVAAAVAEQRVRQALSATATGRALLNAGKKK